jgi:hypothetical protein
MNLIVRRPYGLSSDIPLKGNSGEISVPRTGRNQVDIHRDAFRANKWAGNICYYDT